MSKKPGKHRSGRSRGPRSGAGEQPLTEQEIVAAGVRLTAARGLTGWTSRELASEVDCWPTAIVHRIGSRHEVELAIVDEILRMVRLPCEELPWRPWFKELLSRLRPVLVAHPGVARWLGVAAPAVPVVVSMIDLGVRKLVEAGLGNEAPAAHISLLNTAVHLIAAEDERDLDPKLRDSIGQGLLRLRDSEEHPSAAFMARTLSEGFGRSEIYDYAVERALDGVAARIDAIEST